MDGQDPTFWTQYPRLSCPTTCALQRATYRHWQRVGLLFGQNLGKAGPDSICLSYLNSKPRALDQSERPDLRGLTQTRVKWRRHYGLQVGSEALVIIFPASMLRPETCTKASEQHDMNSRTRQNLITAMNCDAMDAAKYGRFAARARMDEDWQLARVFQDTADIDRADHFPSEAELEGMISDSPDNLRAAVDTERTGAAMLSKFAEQATADGDSEAASVFRKISRGKTERLAKFEAVLEELGIYTVTSVR